MAQLLATLEEIRGKEPKRFRFRKNEDMVDGFVLEYNGEVRAYVNMCMHEPVELDLRTGKFWDAPRREVFCKNHGAMFEPLSGKCTGGPCPDTYLKKVRIKVEGDAVYLDLPK